MSMWKQKAKAEQANEVPPAGSHPAILVAMIDLGTHEDEYQGKKTLNRSVLLCWELTAEKVPGIDQNHVVGNSYNLSFGKKSNLRKLVETWRGKAFNDDEEFDITKLMGKPCMVSLSHKTSAKDRTYAKLDAVSSAPKGLTVPPAKIKPLLWSLDDGTPIPNEMWMPFIYGQKLEDVIKDSQEWKAKNGQKREPEPAGVGSGVQGSDEIPF